jgi:hypothetical protein
VRYDEGLATEARDARAHLAVIAVQGGRQKLAIGRYERHRQVLFPHAFRRIAHGGHEIPGRGIHPAKVGGIENDAGGIAIAPLHLGGKYTDDGVERVFLGHQKIIRR